MVFGGAGQYDEFELGQLKSFIDTKQFKRRGSQASYSSTCGACELRYLNCVISMKHFEVRQLKCFVDMKQFK